MENEQIDYKGHRIFLTRGLTGYWSSAIDGKWKFTRVLEWAKEKAIAATKQLIDTAGILRENE